MLDAGLAVVRLDGLVEVVQLLLDVAVEWRRALQEQVWCVVAVWRSGATQLGVRDLQQRAGTSAQKAVTPAERTPTPVERAAG